MPDYQNAKIYKIFSYENDDVYYGSTCDTLCRRMTGHRNSYKLYKEGKSNNNYTSFKILELTSAKIELVENYPCNSKEELLQREGFYIRNNDCVNKYIPLRTVKQYYDEKKETILEQKKEYYKANKEQKKEYYEVNKEQRKEQRKEYREANKDKIKEYCEANKDKIKQYQKEYRQQKKEQQLMLKEDTNIEI
jgi:hypothetical protein